MRRSYAIWREGMMTGFVGGAIFGMGLVYLMCNW